MPASWQLSDNSDEAAAQLMSSFVDERPPPPPLVKKAKNNWERNEPIFAAADREASRRRCPWWYHRYRRYINIFVGIILSWTIATRYIIPIWTNQTLLDRIVSGANTILPGVDEQGLGLFGSNAKPPLGNMIHVQDLDPKFVPTVGANHHGGRLIVIGDVHGMKSELMDLLDKVHFKQHDHLILVGDLITKGPDSLGVLELVQSLHASAVRGNHEDKILGALKQLATKEQEISRMGDERDEEFKEDMRWSFLSKHDRAMAKVLRDKPEVVKWLEGLPAILRVGEIGEMGEVVVVHAGLAPGVPLEKQDPFYVMNMRTIDLKTNTPSENRDGNCWTKAWNYYQKKQHKKNRSTVIYGHDSKRGLRIEDYSKGLDTGCVKGGKLTALVIEGGELEAKQEVVAVKCKAPKEEK